MRKREIFTRNPELFVQYLLFRDNSNKKDDLSFWSAKEGLNIFNEIVCESVGKTEFKKTTMKEWEELNKAFEVAQNWKKRNKDREERILRAHNKLAG